MKPSVSIITICFNNLEELKQTCRSVDEQTISPTEHLVVDGSTNQEILNWLVQNPQPGYRKWIHERDKGISDAFNKGISNSRGEITHLLNSGDRYSGRDSVEAFLEKFETDPGLMWVHSQYIQHRGNMDVISGVPFEKNQLWKGMRAVAHPSMFIRKEVYERHGLYNDGFRIAMDYDMLVRIRDEKSAFISRPLVYFAPGGASNLQFEKGLQEVKSSYQRHVGHNIRQDLWQFRQRALHLFMKTSLGRKWFRWKNLKQKADGNQD